MYGYILLPIVEYLWPILMFCVFNWVVMPTLWPSHRYFLLVFVLFVFYIIHLIFYYFEAYYFLPWLYRSIDYQAPTLEGFVRRYTWWFIYFGLAMIMFAYYRLVIEELKEKNAVENKLAQVQSKFLRSQFNPHFLFNVLNYMYDKASHSSLSHSIMLLADRMRYSLEGGNFSVSVRLSDEIEQIKNYIELTKIQFEEDIFVDINVEGDTSQRKILPRTLAYLFESIFPLSNVHDPYFPLRLKIRVDASSTNLLIEAQKKQNSSKILSDSNFQSVVNRLNIAYNSAYTLNIDDEPNGYTCELKILKTNEELYSG